MGDGDPLDVIDISDIVARVGEIYPVRVLGALMMLDGGEADWKIVVIRASDPKAASLFDISDPSLQAKLTEIRTWFRDYKIPDGKPANEFAFGGQYQVPLVAEQVIEATHVHWLELHNDPSIKPDVWVTPKDADVPQLRGTQT
eukprot:Plantae.Rhodophyta-Rhodochaete_pulchella.ctg5250.p1 GENE.Plantae.Rhodophyta-Rhodochaete_pulchella.ctg5250~~Plantae.Rhodophyta-Rhodochaete_pulchella.ctg5250.p1  ORF type:complete len:143 (+),score=21.22 Plantae.Rhodophyta-Rhodochaete_pulchella.ctg5250:211-639(+)